MAFHNGKRRGVSIGWALSTPFIMAAGLFCLPLVPALCVLLDLRSRTYTGAVTLFLVAAAAAWFLGPAAASVAAFVCIATAAAYALVRTQVSFQTGILGSAGAGVAGAMAMLGILGVAAGKPLNEAAANYATAFIQAFAKFWDPALKAGGGPDLLSYFVYWLDPTGQSAGLGYSLIPQIPQDILNMTANGKLQIIGNALEQVFAANIPSLALVAGLFVGGAGYYLPAIARDRLGSIREEEPARQVPVPPFASIRFPKYIVITLLILQLLALFGADNQTVVTLYVAASSLLTLLMTIQASSLFAFWLTRKHLPTALQAVILIPAALIFSALLEFVGLFDVLFDVRAITARMDAVKAKGVQVFTQGGLDELRKMGGQNTRGKDGKNGKDGEDKK